MLHAEGGSILCRHLPVRMVYVAHLSMPTRACFSSQPSFQRIVLVVVLALFPTVSYTHGGTVQVYTSTTQTTRDELKGSPRSSAQKKVSFLIVSLCIT